jgi:hypothetical protein
LDGRRSESNNGKGGRISILVYVSACTTEECGISAALEVLWRGGLFLLQQAGKGAFPEVLKGGEAECYIVVEFWTVRRIFEHASGETGE